MNDNLFEYIVFGLGAEIVFCSLDSEERLFLLSKFSGMRKIIFEYYCIDDSSRKFPFEQFNRVLRCSKIYRYIHFREKIINHPHIYDQFLKNEGNSSFTTQWISKLKFLINVEQSARFDCDFNVSLIESGTKKDLLDLLSRKMYDLSHCDNEKIKKFE